MKKIQSSDIKLSPQSQRSKQMDFFRHLLIAFSFLIFTPFQAIAAAGAHSGIVFIHGTNDHSKDADGGYWKQDFTRAMAGALPNPDNILVVHCDFSHYMWQDEAAGCVIDQVFDFIQEKEVNELYIYTHSNGSNVIRWILSNPTYNSRYHRLIPHIKQVVSLAPSNGGSPLADEALIGDIFISGLGWLLGYHTDAVRQQRVGDMSIYNENLLLGSKNRPSLPVTYKVVVGTDVTASPLSSASYCNGYMLNSALKIAKLYLNTCSDGFLNCESQEETEGVWFRDIEKTENQTNLSHNQSRHSCFGLEKILINDILSEEARS